MSTSITEAHVPESAFGKWFLRTDTWTNHVLETALNDLEGLLPKEQRSYSVVADVGCGYGRSLKMLQDRFSPDKLIGIDVDPEMIECSTMEARQKNINVEFVRCSNSNMELNGDSIDLLFCHQTFHHLIYQQRAVKEYYRILKPGGILLFAESTKRYIHSWIIRLLFRHPMSVQKTAEEYLQIIRDAGFEVSDESVSYPFLWWSRWDLGVMERLLGMRPPDNREETLINLAAMKPKRYC